ncbi:hypothetical protein DAPPUDRAFT_229967, partial [Daphnia pulex]
MPTKRKKQAETEHGASADPVEQEQWIDESPSAKSTGLKSSLHGNVFQLKLLVLFLIRGIKAKYQFKLGTEIPGMGGKFDDLIFKYKVPDKDSMTQEVQTERYRYLQAKHKQNEETGKITAADLLNDNDGHFSLPKYFRSYYGEVIDGIKGCLPNNVRDCIICTNVGFENETKLKEDGIELQPLNDWDEILNFDKVSDKKSPIRYKLKKTKALRWEMAQWSAVHLLAKTLLEKVTHQKEIALTSPIFKSYHVALVEENVIDKEKKNLCSKFLKGDDSRFREILSEITFVHYWEKLNFKYDDKKKIRHDGKNKLIFQFKETLLKHLLPKYPKNKKQKMEMDFRVFKDFYDELISEKVLVAGKTWKKKPFAKNFIKGKDLTEKGSEFRGKLRNAVFTHFWKDLTFTLSPKFGREIISSTPDENKSLNDLVGEKEIGDFLDKLVFAVHTPNEVQLDEILKTEVSDRYNLNESDFQSDFILRNMLDWFKKKESTFMSSAEGIDILENAKKKMKSLRLTAVSIDYQRKLKEVCGFNEESIQEMAEKLKQLLISENSVKRITSELPKRTAVKVIAALKELRQRKIRQGRGRRLLKILYREVPENLAIKVFGLLFSMEPDIFQDNFQFCTLETRDIFKRETNEILHLLLERDFYTITLLHRAAFNNEIDAIEKILFLIQENLIRGDDRYKTMAEQVVNVMCYDENGFTPFYVAAARGNENVYRKMLFFLKHFHEKQNTSDTLEKILTATNGFVHHALSDAMESENLEMFQVILSSVKDVLGHNTLLKLLKSNSRENVSKNRYDILEYWSDTIFGVACRYKDLFQTLAKIVVEQKDNGSEAYQDWSDWNDLIFHLIESEDFNRFTLKYVSADILQGMLSQKGSNEWTKRLLDLRLWGGFKALS